MCFIHPVIASQKFPVHECSFQGLEKQMYPQHLGLHCLFALLTVPCFNSQLLSVMLNHYPEWFPVRYGVVALVVHHTGKVFLEFSLLR